MKVYLSLAENARSIPGSQTPTTTIQQVLLPTAAHCGVLRIRVNVLAVFTTAAVS